jgi:flagellar L-ring protein FlgH
MNSHRQTNRSRVLRFAFNLQSAICNLQSAITVLAMLLAFAPAESRGQNSSLLNRQETKQESRQGLTLERASWTYQKVPEQRPVGLNDQVVVWVDASSVVISEGQMDRKKNGYGSLTLKDWILLKGLSVIPDPQSLGDPKIRGEVDNKLTSKADLETRDSMKFKMACKVVDIRPNGILVIEGVTRIANNEETWEYSLTGEIRADDVRPDNVVLSQSIAHMRIDKRESGHVRDGYRRGWALKWLDKYQPF